MVRFILEVWRYVWYQQKNKIRPIEVTIYKQVKLARWPIKLVWGEVKYL